MLIKRPDQTEHKNEHSVTTPLALKLRQQTGAKMVLNQSLNNLSQIHTLIEIMSFAKLSQAPAPVGLTLALFPNYPATRPTRPDQTRPIRPNRNSFLLTISQPVLNAILPQSISVNLQPA